MVNKDELITEATLAKHMRKWLNKSNGLPAVAVGDFKRTRGGNIGIEVIVPTTKKYSKNSKELGKQHPLTKNSLKIIDGWETRAAIRVGDPTTVTTTIVVPENELAAILGTIKPLTDYTPEMRDMGVTVPQTYTTKINANLAITGHAPASIKRLQSQAQPVTHFNTALAFFQTKYQIGYDEPVQSGGKWLVKQRDGYYQLIFKTKEKDYSENIVIVSKTKQELSDWIDDNNWIAQSDHLFKYEGYNDFFGSDDESEMRRGWDPEDEDWDGYNIMYNLDNGLNPLKNDEFDYFNNEEKAVILDRYYKFIESKMPGKSRWSGVDY